jgi:hypothetical protein
VRVHCSATALVNISTEPAAEALTTLEKSLESIIWPFAIRQDQLLTEARAVTSELEVSLFVWRQMCISKILSDVVMADIRSQMEKAKRLATNVRARQTAATSGAPELLGRQAPHGDMNFGCTRTNTTAISGFFGSILASMDNLRKRKRKDGDENEDGGEDERKFRKTS